MGGTRKKGAARKRCARIDGEVRGKFLAAVKDGVRLEAAAEAAGCSLPGLYRHRRQDAAFREGWVEALELSALRERARRGPAPTSDGASIAPNNGRQLQVRKMRHVRFDEKRREVFLAHFAGTCDTTAAAEAAGVDESTVYKHRQRDSGFALAWEEALQQGYARLEAEAVRQRLEAQRRLKEGVLPQGEISQEFERVLKLLARWDRRNGGTGPRTIAHGRQKSWTFDEAITLLEKRLQALGVAIPPPEPEEGEAP